MRTFIALELPEQFADQTAQLARALQAHAQGRFMQRSTYHLTLAFLGDIDERQVNDAMDAMDAVSLHPAVPLRAESLGTFKARGGKTLYLAFERSSQASLLAQDLREQLDARSVPFDRKKFLPHVTLARRATIGSADLAELPFPTPASANRVTLFKSTLSSEGATYKPLYTIELA